MIAYIRSYRHWKIKLPKTCIMRKTGMYTITNTTMSLMMLSRTCTMYVEIQIGRLQYSPCPKALLLKEVKSPKRKKLRICLRSSWVCPRCFCSAVYSFQSCHSGKGWATSLAFSSFIVIMCSLPMKTWHSEKQQTPRFSTLLDCTIAVCDFILSSGLFSGHKLMSSFFPPLPLLLFLTM